ncbi:MAG: hypothetical protein ABI488_09420 [Polyangiaceae bacterium]
MNRLAERALLGGTTTGLLLMIAAGCSSTSDPATGSAGASTLPGAGTTAVGTAGAGGGNVIAGGGASGATVGLGAGSGGVGTAGAHSTAGSGGLSSGGVSATAGAASTDDCPTDKNIVNTPSCWVGCDPALTTDNPQGIQGSLYTFGDGTSCPSPAPDPVCAPTKGVCIAGTTKVDPTYAAYGCAIGLELNSSGGDSPTKSAYTGPAKCFDYILTGNSGGNEVRVSFTQSADTAGKVSPYVSLPPFTSGKSGTVCTKDVSCQGQKNCTLGTAPYDIQFEVVGGSQAGAYNVCLSSLTPVADGTSTLAQLCGAQGSANGTADVGKYFVQNNLFPGTASNAICVTPKASGAGAGFTVDSTMFATGADLNAYPSVVDGWHYGRVSSDAALPKQLNSVMSVNSTVSYTGTASKYDAAYDIWVLPTAPTAATATPTGGLEVMIWLNSANVNPAGTAAGQYAGGWDVYVGTVQGWDYVAYRKNGQTTFTGDLKPFLTDAVARSNKLKGTNPYLSGIEFGFEFYDYPGTGFAVTSFTSDVK